MAKIIKCPKCGENVEIPPNAAGTVVKCANCGTGLRIKAKTQPAGGGGGETDRSQGSMGGSISGSMSGTVIGQTGYGQQVPTEPDPDGPPSLGSECAVCGRSVDPDDLIEDRGQLVCSKCAKRPARGAAGAGAAMAPALMPEPDFNPALRHGPMINVNGAFIGGCAALAIVGACQAFLYFYPKPIGTARVVASTTQRSSATKPAIPTVVSWEDQNRDTIRQTIEEARKLVGTDVKGAIAKYDEAFHLIGDRNILSEPLKGMVETARADRTKLADELARAPVAPAPTGVTPATAPAAQETVATADTPKTEAPAPDQAESMPEETKPTSIFELPPDTPELLAPALTALSQKKYQEAVDALEAKKVRPPTTPSRDQRLTLETIAAANLGVGKYLYAEGLLDRASDSYASSGIPVTRSLVLNRALAQLAQRRSAHVIAKDLAAYLGQKGGPPDDVAHAVLGTAVSRVEPNPKIKPEYDQYVNFLNSYTQQLDGTRQAEGKRRWGAAWYDTELVEKWEKHIQAVNEQINMLQPQLEKYLKAREGSAYTGAGAEANEKNYKRISGEIYARQQELKKYDRKWLEKFEPVMPEPEESAAPPPPTPDAGAAPPAPPPPTPSEAVQPRQPSVPAVPPPPPPPQ